MIVLDMEMTGLDPLRNGIIDIAAVEYENPMNTFHMQCRIDEDTEIDSNALKYNGFTNEEITDFTKPTIKQAVQALIKWSKNIEDRTIAGQNVDVDLGFLRAACKKYNLKWTFAHRKVDQHSIAYSIARKLGREIILDKDRVSKLNSDNIMKFVGIPAEPRPHSSALNGVLWQTEALSRLMEGKSKFSKFEIYPIPEYLLPN